MIGAWRRKMLMIAVFGLIVALVVGGLGWATHAALALEQQQRFSDLRAERADQVRLALWRLDSRMAPTLGREDSRPFTHYAALHPPTDAMTCNGGFWDPGQVWLPSPLLNAELPEWMKLHFQVAQDTGWSSPQVISRPLAQQLVCGPNDNCLRNTSPVRSNLLRQLEEDYPVDQFFTQMREHGLTAPDAPLFNTIPYANTWSDPQPDDQPQQLSQAQAGIPQEYRARSQVQSRNRLESKFAYENPPKNYFPPGINVGNTTLLTFKRPVEVRLGSMAPVWLKAPSRGNAGLLMIVRLAQAGQSRIYQGVLLNWPRLRDVLKTEIVDLFPGGDLIPLTGPVSASPELTMTALPVRLEPGPLPALPPAGWTPLRVGLALAWLAALIALSAVVLGGRSLLALSERRFRFVSAVTHELRTPMTTLRLYLDMLTSGMITEPAKKDEYLKTLHCESERLNRLIGNVLAFSRLEKQSPNLEWQSVPVNGLMDHLRQTWEDRCARAGKNLTVDNSLPPETTIRTDEGLLQQILGNLIDNAQKHTRNASDPTIWVRGVPAKSGWLALEVEDRGPGIEKREGWRLFRPFRRGRKANPSAGGVGLGLALAQRWAKLLNGRLKVAQANGGVGACFRLELPIERAG